MPRPTARTTPNRRSDGWGTVAHVCRKVPLVTMACASKLLPKVALPCTVPQNVLPALSLNPSEVSCQTTSRSDRPFFDNTLVIEVYKIVTNKPETTVSPVFEFHTNTIIIGDKYKLLNQSFHCDVRKYSFTPIIVNTSNSLPDYVVNVDSVPWNYLNK